MNTNKGTVQSIGTKQVNTKFGVKETFNLKINGEWYSAGFKRPDVAENDYIQFTWTANGNYKNIDVASILKVANDTSQRSPSVPTGVTMSKDDYWGRKEERDLETQQRIQLQSARNSAIAAVKLLLDVGAVKIPAAQNKKYDAVLALVDEVTAKYYNDTVEMYVAEGTAVQEEEGTE